MKVALLSNTNIDLLINALSHDHDVYNSIGYADWVPLLLNPESALYQYQAEVIFILLDADELVSSRNSFEAKAKEIQKNINIIEQLIEANSAIQFFVSNLDCQNRLLTPLLSTNNTTELELLWENGLRKIQSSKRNFCIFDIKRMIYKAGFERFYSDKLWYLAKQKYSMSAITLLKNEVLNVLNSFSGKRKKCLIVDLDNTLWGGIVAEEGALGIELSEHKEGARFKDFQRRLKQLKQLGVILAVSSKNNYEDVKSVFAENDQMILSENDFAILKINWQAKVDNIKAIALELNIGLDSMVFIDDNPIERSSVSEFLPMVEVIDFPKDTSRLPALAEDIYKKYFLLYELTDSDRKKTQMYLQNQQRSSLKTKFEKKINLEKQISSEKNNIDLRHFLKALETEIKIIDCSDVDLERAFTLVQKTNQFNLTCIRYSRQQLLSFIKQDNILFYIASVSDKYGENGQVAVIIVRLDDKKKTAVLDSFLLSCRVMGRSIEDQLITFVVDKAGNKP